MPQRGGRGSRWVPVTRARPAPRTRSLPWLAAVGALVALLVALSGFTGPVPREIPGSGSFISARYDPPTSGVEVGLARGDGQLFATHAADPFLDQPEQIRGGPEEQAYRFQRPLYGWLGWLASGGQPGAVPWAVVGLTIASVAALVAVAGRLLRDRGGDPRWALVLLAAPGVLADLQRVGPEALGTLLVLVGAVTWVAHPPGRSTFRRGGGPDPDADRAGSTTRGTGGPVWSFVRGGAPDVAHQRARSARVLVPIACFAAAGLLRETLLLVPAALLLHDLVRAPAAGHRRRAVLAGVAVVAPYGGWVLALRGIVGAWPSGTVDGRISVIPFAGLVGAVGSWTALDLLFVAAVLAGAVLVLVRRAGEPWLRWIVAAHLLLAATLGEPVWASWRDWGRVLLPLTAFALVALAGRGAPVPPDPAETETTRTGRRSVAPIR